MEKIWSKHIIIPVYNIVGYAKPYHNCESTLFCKNAYLHIMFFDTKFYKILFRGFRGFELRWQTVLVYVIISLKEA